MVLKPHYFRLTEEIAGTAQFATFFAMLTLVDLPKSAWLCLYIMAVSIFLRRD